MESALLGLVLDSSILIMGERRKLSRIELAKPDHQEHSERRSRAFIPAALRRLDKLFKQQGPLSPVLRSVPDVQDLDNFIRGRVHDYVMSGAARNGTISGGLGRSQ